MRMRKSRKMREPNDVTKFPRIPRFPVLLNPGIVESRIASAMRFFNSPTGGAKKDALKRQLAIVISETSMIGHYLKDALTAHLIAMQQLTALQDNLSSAGSQKKSKSNRKHSRSSKNRLRSRRQH